MRAKTINEETEGRKPYSPYTDDRFEIVNSFPTHFKIIDERYKQTFDPTGKWWEITDFKGHEVGTRKFAWVPTRVCIFGILKK
jgi:hypothetical protein